jgi:hypothetical protein
MCLNGSKDQAKSFLKSNKPGTVVAELTHWNCWYGKRNKTHLRLIHEYEYEYEYEYQYEYEYECKRNYHSHYYHSHYYWCWCCGNKQCGRSQSGGQRYCGRRGRRFQQ